VRILVTGCNGQLGNEIRRCLEGMTAEIGPIPAEYEGASTDYVDLPELDISSRESVDGWFAAHEYDLVVNCAAYTNVDGCETDEAFAHRVNSDGPRNLARAAQRQGAAMVHVSTDYVFSGADPVPRAESDPTGPISAYGRTKLAGEEAVRGECTRHFICRTAWLYGYVGGNFVKTMRRLGATHERITVVDDQLGNPTNANDLAYEILRVAVTENYGTYHMTGRGTCSWAQFAKRIMERSNLDCEVVPVTSEEYKAANPRSADRPHYSSLENRRLAETVGDEMRPWELALDAYIERLPLFEG